MLDGLRKMWRGYRLLRRGVEELAGIRLALDSIAASLQKPVVARVVELEEADPRLDAPYVDPEQQAALLDISQRLTVARGQVPTDEEIAEEYNRRYAGTPLGSV